MSRTAKKPEIDHSAVSFPAGSFDHDALALATEKIADGSATYDVLHELNETPIARAPDLSDAASRAPTEDITVSSALTPMNAPPQPPVTAEPETETAAGETD